MKEFFAIDSKSLNENRNLNLHLAIQVSEHNLMALVLNTVWNKYLAIANFAVKNCFSTDNNKVLEQLLSEKEIFHYTFNSVSAIVVCNKCCLVPRIYFNPNNEAQHLLFNYKVPENYIVHHNLMLKTNAYNVFAMPAVVVNALNNKFGHINYHNQVTSIIENALHLKRNETDTKELIVNIQNSFVDIAIIENTNLLFFNRFQANTISDILYFTMLCCSELNIETRSVSVEFGGEIDNVQEFKTEMMKYFRNLKLKQPDNYFEFGFGLKNIPLYYAANLINLYKCE